MEYVVVSFPEKRTVFVDGQPAGQTNQVLLIEEGTHEFSLGPGDEKVWRKLAMVTDTTTVSPAKIKFEESSSSKNR